MWFKDVFYLLLSAVSLWEYVNLIRADCSLVICLLAYIIVVPIRALLEHSRGDLLGRIWNSHPLTAHSQIFRYFSTFIWYHAPSPRQNTRPVWRVRTYNEQIISWSMTEKLRSYKRLFRNFCGRKREIRDK